jgi:hypothetical protein
MSAPRSGHAKVKSVLTPIREVLTAADPEYHLQQLSDTLVQYFDLRPSEKHRVGRDFWGAWSHTIAQMQSCCLTSQGLH